MLYFTVNSQESGVLWFSDGKANLEERNKAVELCLLKMQKAKIIDTYNLEEVLKTVRSKP